MTISTIKRTLRLLDKNITTVNPSLSYERTIKALSLLGQLIHASNEELADLLALQPGGYGIDAYVIGGYWHLTEWHGGQESDSYRALCSLGTVFDPGFSNGPEKDNSEYDVYTMLEELALDE